MSFIIIYRSTNSSYYCQLSTARYGRAGIRAKYLKSELITVQNIWIYELS